MSDCRPVSTPLDSGTKLLKVNPQDQTSDTTLYQSIIGSLMYACIATRPDLAHAVTLLSQFSSCPNDSHFVAAKHVLRYFLKDESDERFLDCLLSRNILRTYIQITRHLWRQRCM